MERSHTIILSNGKKAYSWTHRDKPSLNHWYRLIGERDHWKIIKDFHSDKDNITYYKVVAYYNSDILFSGKTLAEARAIIRDNTYRMVI